MHVIYKPGQGWSWMPTVSHLPAIKKVYDQWSDAALHYICMFSHPASVHTRISDFAEREKSVLSEMQALKLGKVSPKGAHSYPKGLYEQDFYDAAADALLELQSVPDITHVQHLKRKLSEYQKQQDSIKWSADVDTFNKQTTAAKNIAGVIREVAKDLSEAEGALQKLISSSGEISLDEIWNGV